MIRGLLFCAIACSIAAPALAGERNAATVPAAWVLPTLDLPASDYSPALGAALLIAGDFAVTLHDAPTTTIALADFEDRIVQRFDLIPGGVDDAVPVSPYAAADLRSLAAWHLNDRVAPTTTSASGFYAVRDLLGDYRRPRAFRPTALSTTFVLRIDGREETAPLGIGGGGVAAVLWHARSR